MNSLHPHALPDDGFLTTRYIEERVDMLNKQNWREDSGTRRQLVQSLDILAEHLVGRRTDADQVLKDVIRRLRAEVAR